MAKKCFMCEMKEATDNHHIFFGTGIREIADKYGFVIPLCKRCHMQVHNSKETKTRWICDKLVIHYNLLNNIFRKCEKDFDKDDIEYLEECSKQIKEFVKIYEYN